jgi:hypothetical protein
LKAVFTTCLRCDAAFPRNTELAHLPVGRRIAFDTETGRLWVICPRCEQWNLAPLESRWEAIAEADLVAAQAEAQAAGTAIGLARTQGGLELLRVGGLPASDIANWRYGQRLERRRRWFRAVLAFVAVAGGMTGVYVASLTGAAVAGLNAALLVGGMLYYYWQRPPRLWFSAPDAEGRRRRVAVWNRDYIRLERDSVDGQPVLVLPTLRGDVTLRETAAARALVALLPQLRVAESSREDLARAVRRVEAAEQSASRPSGAGTPPRKRRRKAKRAPSVAVAPPLRPWQHVILHRVPVAITTLSREHHLALEMAVNEELEQRQLAAGAEASVETWRSEEEIGAIADGLFLPEGIDDRLRKLKGAP